jgi:hypothetical protein
MTVETLRPNAAGDLTELHPNTGTNWGCVDETPSDGDSTYVGTLSADLDNPKTDLYNLPASAIPLGSTISNVRVYMNVRSLHSTYRATCKTKIKTHGTVYTGEAKSPPTTYTSYFTDYAINPYTGAAWAISEINDLQIGECITSNYHVNYYYGRCTQSWVEITYTIGGAVRTILMDGAVFVEY